VVENCHQAAAAESDLIRKSQNSLVMLTIQQWCGYSFKIQRV